MSGDMGMPEKVLFLETACNTSKGNLAGMAHQKRQMVPLGGPY